MSEQASEAHQHRPAHHVSRAAGAAGKYFDTPPTDDPTPVVLVQLIGRFSVENTGPPGSEPWSGGNVMIVEVDADAGDMIAFSLGPNSDHPRTLTNPEVIFQR